MEAKSQITSMQTIKPSSATPNHLKYSKLSFLDQISPHEYFPILLFYTASDVRGYSFASLCDKLKVSLSNVLVHYYPLCGRIKGNAYVECNDRGVLFVEARMIYSLANILENPQVSMLKQLLLLPVDESDNEEPVPAAVQVSEFSCGGVGLGLSISHLVADGIAAASFLNAWVAMTNGSGAVTKPYMEGSLLFPTREMNFSSLSMCHFDNRGLATARLVFSGTSLNKLKAEILGQEFGCVVNNYNPTRVEAVTALVWNSLIEASCKHKKVLRSFATHSANIRNQIVPMVPEQSIGNFFHLAVTPLVELDLHANEKIELRDLAMMVRKSIVRLDSNYISKIVGGEGFDVFSESMKQVMPTNLDGIIQWCIFSSWTRFPLYQVDFGWGKPIWVSTVVNSQVKNAITLMPTKCGQGIEAWVVNLDEQDMVEFVRNTKLLQYASVSRA